MSSQSNLTFSNGPEWDSPENHGPVVSVISWLLIVAAFLTIATRVATRWAVVRQIRSDDTTIMIALLFAIGQTIAVSLEVTNGLGHDIDSLSDSQLVSYQKNAYAADFLYIGSIWLAKISLCLYLNTLTPKRGQRTIGLTIGAITTVWAISAIFVHGFQCALPHTWDFLGGKCIDLVAFWTYFDVLNIVTDLGLITLPFLILLGLQVDTGKKVVILACFATRIFTIIATILQIYYLNHAYSKAPTDGGLPYTLYLPVLLTQIVQALSLITACIPYLKPFLEALETGMIRAGGAGNTRTYGFGSKQSKDTTSHTVSSAGAGVAGGESGTHKHKSSSSGGGGGVGGSKLKLSSILGARLSQIAGGGSTQRSFGNGGAVKMESLANGGGVGGTNEGGLRNNIRSGDSDRDSQGSRTGIITKTVGWEVRDDEGTSGSRGGEV